MIPNRGVTMKNKFKKIDFKGKKKIRRLVYLVEHLLHLYYVLESPAIKVDDLRHNSYPWDHPTFRSSRRRIFFLFWKLTGQKHSRCQSGDRRNLRRKYFCLGLGTAAGPTMAPVKISHIVSFSSQDPKYPVENLLNPDHQKGPWLSCPQDKSGQLKVELQLERAVPIGYVDVGNCGCAFLQIDVGRSSWSLDRPFVTLLPATMLMSLADSKQGKNRSGVRMFKDDDFLAAASGESWDRLRLTCSQPFTRQQSFGLAFIRVCSSLDSSDDPVGGPSAPGNSRLTQGSNAQESGPSPWLANPSIRRTFFPDPQTSTKEISELRNILKQLQPGALGRSARMVLSAARRVPPTSMASTKNSHTEPGPSHPGSTELRPEEQNSENNVGRTKRRKVQAHRPLSSLNSRPNQKRIAKAGQREHRRPQAQSNGVQDSALCPICSGSFSVKVLPQHAATCGEISSPHPDSPSSSPPSSPSVLWVSSPDSSPPTSWVQCPICQLDFSAEEVEEHASMCGEVPQA